jgi:hypothetical protein
MANAVKEELPMNYKELSNENKIAAIMECKTIAVWSGLALSSKQGYVARKCMQKYAWQLTRIANQGQA